MQTWLGKILIMLGIFCLVAGLILVLAPRIPWLGRLPGDIRIERDRFSFYLPLVTCLLVSIVLTVLLNLFLRR